MYLDSSKLNDINQPKPNSFDETILNSGDLNIELEKGGEDFISIFNSIYPHGFYNIPLYVFNYMDYKLWKKYVIELRGNKARKNSESRISFLNHWAVVILSWIILIISIFLGRGKVWSIITLKPRLVKICQLRHKISTALATSQ